MIEWKILKQFNKQNSNRIEHVYYKIKIEQIRIEQQNERKDTGENIEMEDNPIEQNCTIELTKIECTKL